MLWNIIWTLSQIACIAFLAVGFAGAMSDKALKWSEKFSRKHKVIVIIWTSLAFVGAFIAIFKTVFGTFFNV